MLTRTLAWALAATFPSAEGVPGLDTLDVGDGLRQLRREAAPLFKLGLYGSVLAFIFTPLLTVGWPLPAFLLPRAALDRHAAALSDHRFYVLRQAMLMVKTVGGALWGAHPTVRQHLGLAAYGPDPGTFRGDHDVAADLRRVDAAEPATAAEVGV
mgnify:CR=1 FL=1